MTASAGRLDHLVPVIFLTVGLLGAGCKSESSSQENPEPSEHASSEPSSDQSHDAQPSEAQDREPSPAVKAVPDDEALGELEPTPPDERPESLAGETTPEDVLGYSERWRESLQETQPDSEAADKLASLSEPATVTVYFGAWCPDSIREVTQFWSVLREARFVAFDVEYVGLNRDFEAGDVDLEDADVNYVPTFVVERDGRELGRIVESAPGGIGHDLFALMSGNKEGVVSKRTDL